MKILWIKTDLLHPTTKGGHIRTLELLKQLHKRHQIHYVAFDNDPGGEGVRRSSEYCTRVYPIAHRAPPRTSPVFAWQLIQGLFSPLPVAVFRYRSAAMRELVSTLMNREKFDSVVCDFVIPAVNIPAIDRCVIFQHNVETLIWRRHAATANWPQRAYLSSQARRMFAFERAQCQAAGHVIAVSDQDAQLMREMFGLAEVSTIPTGVDVEYFTPAPPSSPPTARSGLVFAGSMDWLPNIDGMRYFCQQILPIIRKTAPECRVTIVGRSPTAEIRQMSERDPLLEVTGTVPDVRPYLWRAAASIVPLRIGGGTRMKIYEAMAARTPVVSTTIGAEGLQIHPPRDIRIADDPESFAAHCLELLHRTGSAESVAAAAWDLVNTHFGWRFVAERFEAILQSRPPASLLRS